MSNMYEDSGYEETMPLSTGPGHPGNKGGGWSGRKRAAALLAAAAVAGGGAFAAVAATTGSPAAAASTGAAVTTATTTAGQAAALDGALTGTGGHRLARLRRLSGLYGEYTFETKKGARTLAFERGTVTAVSGSDVTVRARNGTTFTWQLTGTSVVRENGTKEPASTLAAGERVFAGGPVTSGTRDARLIVIRKAAAKSAGTA